MIELADGIYLDAGEKDYIVKKKTDVKTSSGKDRYLTLRHYDTMSECLLYAAGFVHRRLISQEDCVTLSEAAILYKDIEDKIRKLVSC